MNSKRSLMSVLVGLAMLATPIAAAAKDFKHNGWNGQYVAPAVVTKHDFKHGAVWVPPSAVAGHDWHHGWNAADYRGYGTRGYYTPVYTAPVYAAPVYSGYGGGNYGGGYGGGGGGGGCGQAQRVMRTYARDRATGHPAAAADLLRQNQGIMRSGCATGAPIGRGRGFGGLGGLGGYGASPAYGNGGYGNGAYNGGYAQPYGGGSMLAPLMQYIR